MLKFRNNVCIYPYQKTIQYVIMFILSVTSSPGSYKVFCFNLTCSRLDNLLICENFSNLHLCFKLQSSTQHTRCHTFISDHPCCVKFWSFKTLQTATSCEIMTSLRGLSAGLLFTTLQPIHRENTQMTRFNQWARTSLQERKWRTLHCETKEL